MDLESSSTFLQGLRGGNQLNLARRQTLNLSDITHDSPRQSPRRSPPREVDFAEINMENRNNNLHKVIMSPTVKSPVSVLSNNQKSREIDDKIEEINRKAKELELENAMRRLEAAQAQARAPPPPAQAPVHRRRQVYESPLIESVRERQREINAKAAAVRSGFDAPPQKTCPPGYTITRPLIHAQEVPRVLGSDEMPDYSLLTEEQQEEYRNMFWTKISILLEKNPVERFKIPDENSSVAVLHRFYNDEIKRIKVKASQMRWKMGMGFSMIFFEGIMNHMSNVDTTGFCEFQMKNFIDQEQILVELGEKYISTGAGAAEPEYKLFTSLLFYAMFFFLIKFLNWKLMLPEGFVADVLGGMMGTSFNGSRQAKAAEETDKYAPEEIPEQNNDEAIAGLVGKFGSTFGYDLNSAETVAKLGTTYTKKIWESNQERRNAPPAGPKKRKISVKV